MRKLFIIPFLLFPLSLFSQAKGDRSYLPFDIDPSLAFKLKTAKENSDLKGFPLDDCFWFFSDSLETQAELAGESIRSFYDTLSSYGDGVCDCMIKNDTVTLQGGIAYEGGIGFDVRITRTGFNGNIWIAGKGYRTDSTSAFQRELVLKSSYQTLKLHNPSKIAYGETLLGVVYMESEPYISVEDIVPNKLYMKILFSCKLDRHIVF